jgi:hypothetical protein
METALEERTETDEGNLFEGLPSTEMDPFILKRVFDKLHPKERFATFEVESATILGLGDISSFKIVYGVHHEGICDGRYECMGDYYDDPDDEQKLYISESRRLN